METFSPKLLDRPEAANPDALKRIAIAKKRAQSILDRERVANQKTLEQKISDQGPVGMRVDPHLVGLALMDLLELNRLKIATHPATGATHWYANLLTSKAEIDQRLDILAPLYQSTQGHFSNLVGDALEIITEKSLDLAHKKNAKYVYQGHFLLDQPKDNGGRYKKIQPPKSLGSYQTNKEADFIQFGHDEGAICIECKNYREWIYPTSHVIKELIIKSSQLGSLPLLVARRIHYTARENLFKPAGIMFHETLFQYYPLGHDDIVKNAKDKSLLGFSDIRATEEPDRRTVDFFTSYVPGITAHSAALWEKNREVLEGYADGKMDLGELYRAIGSPGAKTYHQAVPF